MPFCPKCGREARAGEAQCAGCGFDLSLVFPAVVNADNQSRSIPAGARDADFAPTGTRDQGERVLYQCTFPEFWAKDSFGVITFRSIPSGVASTTPNTQYNIGTMAQEDLEGALAEFGGAAPPPTTPTQQAPVLLVTDRRLVLMTSNRATLELKTDVEGVARDLQTITVANEKAAREWLDLVESRRGDGRAGRLRELTTSAYKDFDLRRLGAQFFYRVLSSAEAKGHLRGGREIELKLEVLNLTKKIEGVSGLDKITLSRQAALKEKAVRSYGLRFREERLMGEVAALLHTRAALMEPILVAYRGKRGGSGAGAGLG